MRALVVALMAVGGGLTSGGILVTFEGAGDAGSSVTTEGVRLDEGRLATVAVMGANPAAAHLGEERSGAALELEGYDPVTRLAILKHGKAEGEGGPAKRGASLSLAPGDPLFLVAGASEAPSRVVKWETSYDGKILPVALLRVHHPGSAPPKPGAPLFNAAGALVAVCHQPAPQFGNGTFALPVEVLTRVESDLASQGRVTTCWIGVTVDASKTVLALEMVRPESPGAKAGLRKGDILLSVGPREVRTYADARNAFYYLVAGEETPLDVLRGTQRLNLKVTPEVHPTFETPGDGAEGSGEP